MVSKALVLGVLLGLQFCRAQDQTQAVISIQEALKAQDVETASRLINESLARHPQAPGILNLRGIVHAQRNEMAEARADFAEAVRLSPALTPAWQNLARACQQLRDSACAVNAWQRVLNAKPADTEARSSLERLGQTKRLLDLIANGRISDAKAIALRIGKDVNFSEADFDAIYSSIDASKSAVIVAALAGALEVRQAAGISTLQRLAVACEHLRQLTDARKMLERVAGLEPDNAGHLLELARVAELSRDHEGALSYLAHARDLQPGNPQIHFLFGSIAGEMNLPIEAKQSLDKALAADPDNPNYNYAMGSAILKTRDAATAAGYFQKFVKAHPADARGHYALGLAHFASGDYANAKREMTTAAVSPDAAAAAQYYLGRIARLEGDVPQAEAHLRKSLALMPKFSETHTELARLAMLQGNLEEARIELDRAVKLAPESFQANEQLLVLYKKTHDARAAQQAERLKKLDEERSKRAELMLRTIEVRP